MVEKKAFSAYFSFSAVLINRCQQSGTVKVGQTHNSVILCQTWGLCVNVVLDSFLWAHNAYISVCNTIPRSVENEWGLFTWLSA